MKQLQYKILTFFLIFTCVSFSQKKTVYKKSYETEGLSSIVLKTKNIPLQILPSLDSKIHINFDMEFNNYTKNEIKNEIKKLKISSKKDTKKIVFSLKSSTLISQYSFSSYSGVRIRTNFSSNKKKKSPQERKSKSEIIDQIKINQLTKNVDAMVEIIKQVKNDKKAKRQKAFFVIMIPEHLTLIIDAKETRIVLAHKKTTSLSLKMIDGSFQGKEIINSIIDVNGGSLKIEKINGGKLNLKNATKNLIGELKESNLKIETSKIEIGEVGKNVTIQDFNSELFLYNFLPNFKEFNFTGEYSKIHFYEPTDDYGMTALGHNTTFHFDGNTVISQPSKKNKKSKMMDRQPKKKNPSGNINFDLIHSIFYYPTSIIINKQTP